MQCPRCGWQNPYDITACQRCGLPVDRRPAQGGYGPSGGHGGYPPAQQGGAPAPYGGSSPAPPHPAYGQTPSQQSPAPYQQPYGAPGATSYPYATATYGPGWSSQQAPASRSGARLARLLLVLATLAAVVYGVWALTARRGIFQDFVSNRTVTLGDARTSDHVDTVLLVVAGALAVIALAWWLVRLMAGRARGGWSAILGFVVSGIGMVCIVVGLVMSGTVDSSGNRVVQGRHAATAAVVTGCGFFVLALGLLIGLMVVNARRDANRQSTAAGTGGTGSNPASPAW